MSPHAHESRGVVAPAPPRHARLGAYAWWQLRDYLLEKGIGTIVVMLFAGSLQVMALRAGLPSSGSIPFDAVRPVIQGTLSGLVSLLVLLGVLFATNGIVSEDRRLGYYRFLFAKPVAVPRFYLQKLLVYGLGFLLVASALLLTFNLLVSQWLVPGAPLLPALPPKIFPVLAVMFLALGGIGFLVSVIWRVDWLSFMTVYILAGTLWPLFGEDEGWRGVAVRALPPLHRLDDVYRAAVLDNPLPMDDVRWIVLYGLACFVIGLAVLRRRSLAG